MEKAFGAREQRQPVGIGLILVLLSGGRASASHFRLPDQIVE
jgi:hypothetical protein